MKNAISAILVLDGNTNTELEKIRLSLHDYGIRYQPLYGHITIAHFLNINIDEIIAYSKAFIEGKSIIPLEIDEIFLMSTNCIACLPNKSHLLDSFYYEYHQKYDSFCDKWTSLNHGLWLPHCSLYYSEDSELPLIYEQMKQEFTPFTGYAVKFELSLVNEDGYQIVYSQPLNKKP